MSMRSPSKSIAVRPSASARMRRLTSLVTKMVGSPFAASRTSSATIWIGRWAICASPSVVGTERAAEATRILPPLSGNATPSDRRAPFERSPSSIRATSRAFRPRSEASFLEVSISSRTKIGMTTSLSANWRIARGSWRRTLVSRTKCFIRARLLRLLDLAVRDRHLLHDDVGLGLVARTALHAGDLGDQRERIAQAEDGVPPRQVLRRPFGDEELRPVRSGPLVRHRQQRRL